MKNEIKSTETGFIIVDDDGSIVSEFNRDELFERLLKGRDAFIFDDGGLSAEMAIRES